MGVEDKDGADNEEEQAPDWATNREWSEVGGEDRLGRAKKRTT